MSKVRFDAAKEMIGQKKYDAAKVLLQSINDPKAREWEQKLDDQLEVLRLKKERELRRGYWIKLALFFAAVLFLLLLGNMLGSIVYLLDPTAAVKATLTAHKVLLQTPIVARQQTETALPHYTLTPIPNVDATHAAHIYETKTVVSGHATEAYNLVMGTVQANSTASSVVYVTLGPIVTTTNTPYPTPTASATSVITAMPPTTYYALRLLAFQFCPSSYNGCDRVDSRYYLQIGAQVLVVGIADSLDPGNQKPYYAIQIPGGDGTIYYIEPTHLSLFTPTPRAPTARP